MAPPLVTIISPTYNQERFVAECAESALVQTYPHWEQIFVDDGSSDRTREILASYRDDRIRVLSLPHRGLGALAESYNAALAASTGPLVGILEGDDRWPGDKLELQVPVFDDPNVTLTWGRATTIDERDLVTGSRSTMHAGARNVRFSTATAFRRLTRSNFLTPSVTVMVRRSALDTAGGFAQVPDGLYVDLPTWLRVTALTDGEVAFLDRVLGVYRVHPAQTTKVAGGEMSRQHLQAVLQVVESLDAATRARIGWTDHLRRRAVSRGRLAEGESLLASGQFSGAMALFRDAFVQSADFPDRLLALAGLGSALVHADFVGPAIALRHQLRQLRGG